MRASFFNASVIAIAAGLALPTAIAQSDSSDDDGSSLKLPGVTVTATKREASLLDTPVAVSAFGGEDLETQQALNVEKLSLLAPNLKINKNQTTANSAQVYLRGVGQDDSTPVNEPGVAIYIDDTYIARTQGGLFDLVDIERIEVLRGPQGTLYGRNSSGGAIKIVTRKPELQEARGLADFTIGSFNRLDIRGSFSAPIIEDKLGFKIEGISSDRDGYVRRVRDGRDINRVDRNTLRGAIRYLPSENVTIDISADYTQDRSGEQSPIPLAPGNTLPGGRTPLFDFYVTDSNVEDINEYEGTGLSGTVTWDLENYIVKSTTAYREFDNVFDGDLRGRSDTSGGGLDLFRELSQSQFTQEFQIVSDFEGPWSFVGGAFFLQEEFNNIDDFLLLHDYEQDATSYAVYGEATLDLTDQLSVTAGGRYTYDEKEFSIDAAGFNGPFAVSDAEDSWSRFTPKILVSFEPNDTSLIYASWQEGYKAGAFQGFPQSAADVTDQTLDPEIVSAFELGYKTELFDGRVQLNTAAYYQDYQDLQIAVFRVLPGGLFAFQSANAQAENYGLEVEVLAALTEELSLSASVGTFEGEYTDAADAVIAQVGVNEGAMKFMPNFAGNMTLSYRKPLDNGGTIIADGSVSYTDDVFFSTSLLESNSQEAHELVDLRIGYEAPDGAWSLILAGENVTDVEWAPTGTAASDGSLFVAPPATWSLRLGLKY